MNEQIQQMIFSLNDKVGVHWTHEDKIKFAQLIVQECVNICKGQEYKYWRSSEEDQWTPIDSANAIALHFGVEE